jgi:hypothetical protein
MVSLIGFFGAATLWAFSPFIGATVDVSWGGKRSNERWRSGDLIVGSLRSGFSLGVSTQETNDPEMTAHLAESAQVPLIRAETFATPVLIIGARAVPPWWNRLGFFNERSTDNRNTVTRVYEAIGFPHWLPLPLFAMIPALSFSRDRKRRLRQREGLCAKCGYDLRASTDRCPECGTQIARGMGNLPMHSAAQQHA